MKKVKQLNKKGFFKTKFIQFCRLLGYEIIDQNSFEVPKAMITQQENYLKEDLKKNLAQQGFNEEMMKDYFDKWSEDLSTKAEFQVKSGLVLEELAKKYNVESSDSDLNEKIAEMTKGS